MLQIRTIITNWGITHDTEEWCEIWRKTDLWFGKWHEEFGKFLPEHSEVSKLGLWDPFIQSRKCMSLKFTEEWCVMTLKEDTKFEEELTCRFKIEMRNLTNLDSRTWKSQILHFNGLPLTKIYVSAEKVQRSYVSSHWGVMQNLNKNWFVVWKWQKFGKSLPEHLNFSKLGPLIHGILISEAENLSLKFTEEFCIMTVKNNAKFQ